MKGLILAGGAGTRLYPATMAGSKQLLPVYDKPMIYYPLATLMEAGIRDILIITTPDQHPRFSQLLDDGSSFGVNISYATQNSPNGIAEAFLVGEQFIRDDSVTLILGDNLFFGNSVHIELRNAFSKVSRGVATVFAYTVRDPERYGVVEFSESGEPLNLVEKPMGSRSNSAVTGLYVYPADVVEAARSIKPSQRGELEITDINISYLSRGRLAVAQFEEGVAWLDTGTHDALLEASQFVHAIQSRQGIMIGCLEGIAFRNDWITSDQLAKRACLFAKTPYGQYLSKINDLMLSNN